MAKKIVTRSTYRSAEHLFWNDSKTIAWFKDQPYSDYWVQFFKSRKNRKKLKVLDIGCGGGRNAEMLLSMGFQVYACDKFKGMVQATRQRLIDLGVDLAKVNKMVLKAHMTKLPFSRNFFNLVLSHGVLHNAYTVREFYKGFQEISRILKPRAHLCVNIFTPEHKDRSLTKLPEEHLYRTREGLRMVLFSPDEIVAIAKKFGLDVVPKTTAHYVSHQTTGDRSVFRAIFKRNSMDKLVMLRKKIDTIDESIITLIYKRQSVIAEIAVLKWKRRMPITSRQREKVLKKMHARLSKHFDLEVGVIREIFSLLLRLSKKRQKELRLIRRAIFLKS